MTLRTPESELLPIIFDNTVLSNFALVQSFELLRRLYGGRAFICRAVLQEIQVGIESGWKYPQLRSRTRLQAVNQALEEGWLPGLKQKSSPNKAQSLFKSEEHVTIVLEPLKKTIRHRCPKCL